MSWPKWIGLAAGVLLVAVSSCSEEESPGAGGAAGSAGSGVGTGGTGLTAGSGGSGATGGVGTGGEGGGLECFEFSNDSGTPLALDGTFDTTTPTWQRPHDDPPICPATALLPGTAALVPYVVYAFCNNDAVEHTYDFEMLAQDGPYGEPPLDDPYLFLYRGQGIPADPLQCLAVNDDIPDSLNVTDSEILDVSVPAGGAITVVGTTVTYHPTDGTGQGYYILVVSNAD